MIDFRTKNTFAQSTFASAGPLGATFRDLGRSLLGKKQVGGATPEALIGSRRSGLSIDIDFLSDVDCPLPSLSSIRFPLVATVSLVTATCQSVTASFAELESVGPEERHQLVYGTWVLCARSEVARAARARRAGPGRPGVHVT